MSNYPQYFTNIHPDQHHHNYCLLNHFYNSWWYLVSLICLHLCCPSCQNIHAMDCDCLIFEWIFPFMINFVCFLWFYQYVHGLAKSLIFLVILFLILVTSILILVTFFLILMAFIYIIFVSLLVYRFPRDLQRNCRLYSQAYHIYAYYHPCSSLHNSYDLHICLCHSLQADHLSRPLRRFCHYRYIYDRSRLANHDD